MHRIIFQVLRILVLLPFITGVVTNIYTCYKAMEVSKKFFEFYADMIYSIVTLFFGILTFIVEYATDFGSLMLIIGMDS